MALSDRIGVMCAGALVGILERNDTRDIEHIAQLMTGVKHSGIDNHRSEEET